jgi:hypothetical protein
MGPNPLSITVPSFAPEVALAAFVLLVLTVSAALLVFWLHIGV